MLADPISRRLITLALEEDLGPGDVTSALIPEGPGRTHILAKQGLVLAGTAAVDEVFRQIGGCTVQWHSRDGEQIPKRTRIGFVDGPARSLLIGERPALNLLQRLCGIATMTRKAVVALTGTNATVVDTRKTTPGMRSLEKAAVRAGGGTNHRFGLFDGVLIKDNHVQAMGGVKEAVREARRTAHHLLKIEVEVSTMAQVDEAVEAGADVIMLDNMTVDQMREAVEKIAGRAVIEASGNVTLERLQDIGATGVDIISMGALTHSAPAADLSMEWDT